MNINGLSVLIYTIIAVGIIAFGTKISKPGFKRVFVFTVLFSAFFSMGIVAGHGIGVFPGILLMGNCMSDPAMCSRMYGDTKGVLLLVILPMLVQWIIILMVSSGLFYLARQTGFNLSVPIVMSEKAKKHRRIIGVAWILLAVFWVIMYVTVLLKLPANQLAQLKTPFVHWDLLFTLNFMRRAIVILLFLGGGYALLNNLSWSRWLCFPLSICYLLNFPFGTAVGGYYLWYYLTIEKQT